MPFITSRDDDAAPRVQLRIVTPNRFQVVDGFAYRDHRGEVYDIPPHDPAGPPTGVSPADFYTDANSTDLASIPWFLWSFYASYGRQSLPALLHDALCVQAGRAASDGPTGPDRAWALRSRADRLFRESLGDQGVRPFRRAVFFAGVTAGKYAGYGFIAREVVMFGQLVLGLVTSSALLATLVLRLDGKDGPTGWAPAALAVSCAVVLLGIVLRRRGDWVLPAVSALVGTFLLVYVVIYSVLVAVLNLPDIRPGKGGLDVVKPYVNRAG